MMTTRVLLLAMVLAAPASPARTTFIDDFEDGDRRAPAGLSWISIADDLTGGATVNDLRVTAPGARSKHALRVTGDVAPQGFAGAWVALDGRARPTDLGDFDGIRLRVRGRGALQVALRAGTMAGANYQAPIETTPRWTEVSVPFADLKPARDGSPPLDIHYARFLGVATRPEATGPYDFEIDDVALYASRDGAQVRALDEPTFAQHFEPSPSSELPAGPWKALAQDPPDDGKQKRLPDATALLACFDDAHDRVWFRIELAGPPPLRWLGVNLALDVDGDPADGMAWWGTNKDFHFDRLVSVYGSATGAGYDGTIGIADASEVQARNLNGSHGERVLVVVDQVRPAFVVGIPRGALGARSSIRVVAATGSAFAHNDDVPNEGAAVLERLRDASAAGFTPAQRAGGLGGAAQHPPDSLEKR